MTTIDMAADILAEYVLEAYRDSYDTHFDEDAAWADVDTFIGEVVEKAMEEAKRIIREEREDEE